MSDKILTDDVILEIMFEKGIQEPGTIDKHEAREIICEHYDCKILDQDWPSYADWFFYIINLLNFILNEFSYPFRNYIYSTYWCFIYFNHQRRTKDSCKKFKICSNFFFSSKFFSFNLLMVCF